MLQAYHHRAVELRYEGNTYKSIAGYIAVEYKRAFNDDSVRRWFSRGGLLADAYMDYAREENDRRRQLMREELKKLVVKIPKKLEQIMDRVDQLGQPDMVALMAIKTLIDVLGITASDEKGSGDRLKEYFDRLEKAPKQSTNIRR